MYILRTAHCCDNELLTQFDNIVSKGLSTILNCELSEDEIPQASLPVTTGGLGFRISSSLAPSALLASAAGTEELQAIILAQVEERLKTEVPDFTRNRMLERWKAISGSPLPPDEVCGKQKCWERQITEQSFSMLLANCTSQIDKARIVASKAAPTDDCLNAPPITFIGLRMCNETIRVAVSLRHGAILREPHQCNCGALVDARGLHGLSCRRSAGKHARRILLNDTIWRVLNKVGVQSAKELTGLLRSDGKRPDGVT